jgi:hypothetical protein
MSVSIRAKTTQQTSIWRVASENEPRKEAAASWTPLQENCVVLLHKAASLAHCASPLPYYALAEQHRRLFSLSNAKRNLQCWVRVRPSFVKV